MADPTPVRSGLPPRWLDAASNSPSTAVLIAIVFLSVPLVVAFKGLQPVQTKPAGSPVTGCEFSRPIRRGDTLASISSSFFDDPSYGWAILVATNLQNGAGGYKFVSAPLELPVGQKL